MTKLTTKRLSLRGLITKLKISSRSFSSGCDIKEKKRFILYLHNPFSWQLIRSGLWLNILTRIFFVLNWSLETERKRGEEWKGGASICCSTHLCIHWLILVRALTRNRICNLGVLGEHSKKLSYSEHLKSCSLVHVLSLALIKS